jgi:hypothetical protein
VSSSNSPLSLVIPIAIIVMIILRRQGVRQGLELKLAPNERLRPLLAVWIDPLLAFLFAGGMLWKLIDRDLAHVAIAFAGGVLGLAVGYLRGRVVFVRAVSQYKSVVTKRNVVEYLILIILFGLRIAEDAIAKRHANVVTAILCGFIALAISESLVRAATLTQRYRRSSLLELALPSVQAPLEN